MEEDDAIVILQEIIEIKAKSAIFGRLLKLERVRINLIHQEQSDPQDHLLQVVDMFLEEELNPTWRIIINTLRHPLLNNYQLAQTIQMKYQGIINSYYVTYKFFYQPSLLIIYFCIRFNSCLFTINPLLENWP